jgi:triphosphatase
MASESKEIELKLRVDAAGMAALKNHPSLAGTLHDPVRETLVSVYFDSPDRIIRDHGMTLRVRRIGDQRIQTIKSEISGSGSFERLEWGKPIDGDKPDLTDIPEGELGLMLSEGLGETLKPVFQTRVERTSYRLNGGGNEVMLAFDEGKIVANGASSKISEVEIELKRGHPSALFKVARTIGQIVPASLDVKSKSERGYELAGGGAADVEKGFEPELLPGMPSSRAFGRACMQQLLVNQAAMINKRHPEALHQMRIALRRLRAAISLFKDVVTDDRVEAIKTELKWIGSELAPARDLDSFVIEALRPLHKQQADQPGLESIARLFARERIKSHKRAREAVESQRFRALVIDTAEWIEAGPWNTSEDSVWVARRVMPIDILAASELSQRSKKVRKRGAKIDELDADGLHQLRIQIKKTRYATEFFSSLYAGKKAVKRHDKFHTTLKQLQNCLGGFNDITMRKALCSEILDRPGKNLTEEQNRHRAFAAGLIIGDQQAQIRKLLERAKKAHARFAEAKAFWK